MKKYIFRLDDISWDMNYENFKRIKQLFTDYGIKPIIGVIPKNEDPKLKKQSNGKGITQNDFWEEIRILQKQFGWSIALHGYNHVYTTTEGGILNTNKRSEFAGVNYETQYKKIKEGKKILEKEGLTIDSFMAPAHSFDNNTIKALKNNGIDVITDGFTLYPYKFHDILLIPQRWPWPPKGFMGIETVCFHINEWDENRFVKLKYFLENNSNMCISFQDALSFALQNERKYRIVNKVSTKQFVIKRKLRSIAHRLRRENVFHRKKENC